MNEAVIVRTCSIISCSTLTNCKLKQEVTADRRDRTIISWSTHALTLPHLHVLSMAKVFEFGVGVRWPKWSVV